MGCQGGCQKLHRPGSKLFSHSEFTRLVWKLVVCTPCTSGRIVDGVFLHAPCETSALAWAAVLGHSLCFPLSSLACSALEFQPRNGCAFPLGHDGRQERVCCLLLVVVFLGTVPLSASPGGSWSSVGTAVTPQL